MHALRTSHRRGLAATAALTLAVLLTGCSSSGGNTTPAASSGGSGQAATLTVAAAKAAVARNYQGTDRSLPTSSPKPQRGKNVWVVSCTQAAPGCSIPISGLKEAAGHLGWRVTVFDGKGTPEGWDQGIRNAITDHADAIVLGSVDCNATLSALKAATAAGIKIYPINSFDCDDEFVGGKAMFSAEPLYGTLHYGQFVSGPDEQSIADYIVTKTAGSANIIEIVDDSSLVGRHANTGFEHAIAGCRNCKIVTKVHFTESDLISGALTAKVSAALTRYPTANTVYSPYDAPLLLGGAQAVKSSGRSNLIVTGLEGLPPAIDLIRSKAGITMDTGNPALRLGWATADGLNRVFAGQPQVDEGIGVQTIDDDHNLPKTGSGYEGNVGTGGAPKIDYQATYLKIWGAS